MADLPLLITITIALAYALAGGLIARRLGLPTIVGYLVAGVALGPFTPGFQGDPAAIHQLAEFGVILLMFGIGLHFSFKDLWDVRDIAIPGAILQMIIATILGYALARAWGWTTGAALVLGIAGSVASTVVLLRGLTDNGLLDTLHGKVAVGWLVLEDLATIVILLLLPVLSAVGATPAGAGSSPGWQAPAIGIIKALAFVTLMLVVGVRVVPAVLGRIVNTRSRELFVLVALTVAAGTALASSALFGVSIALGAFLAGVVVGESPFSHQIGADLLPFREAFAVLFFVSVGMLVNPSYLMAHWTEVLGVSVLIVAGKSLATVATGFLFPYPARTTLVVAAGRSQIGEFSFIVGQSGLALGLITEDQYSLILAGAIVSITVNPLMFRLVNPIDRWLASRPRVRRLAGRDRASTPPPAESLRDHVIVVGCGRVGRHIAEALGRLQIPRVVIEMDPARLDKLKELGIPVVYGDAASSDILEHTALTRARALVITLPDDAAAMAVMGAVRRGAPDLRVIARASTWEGARRLMDAGAGRVVRPELEGGIEIMRRTLLALDLPAEDVQIYADVMRGEEMNEPVIPPVPGAV